MAKEFDIEEMQKDISSIKEALAKNASALRRFSFPALIAPLWFIAGVLIILICVAYGGAIKHYGAYSAITAWKKYALLASIVLVSIGMVALELTLVRNALKKQKIPLGVFEFYIRFIKEFRFLAFIEILAIALFVSIIAGVRGHPELIMPVVFFSLGAITLSAGLFLRVRTFVAFGYWQCAFGALSIVCIAVNPLLWIGLGYGVGCILMALIAMVEQKRGGA